MAAIYSVKLSPYSLESSCRLTSRNGSAHLSCLTANRLGSTICKKRYSVARAEAEKTVVANSVVESKDGEVKKAQKPKMGFVDEMRVRAMKLHTRDQSKEGEKAAQESPLARWQPTKEGYVQFLVDSKAVYAAMEEVVQKAVHPSYAEFRNTGLERTQALTSDLAWFESQGLVIPEVGKTGSDYAAYLLELSVNDPPAFICHFYNVYFAHSAGGRMIGKKVAEMILDGRELEFYTWQGDLKELLSAVKEKLNLVSEEWSSEQKAHCLEETEKSFKYSGSILKLLVS